MARASFSTLPLELKARIVEMTSNQEDAWWLRVRKNEHAGHISSLSSLALVNKELRALAAKHQFKRLSSRKASRPVFRFTIFPRYGHHITEVKLTGNNESQLDDVLAIMSQLPALCSLLFWHEAAMTLFGPAIALPAVALPAVPSEETDAGPYRADMLEQISPQIAQLSLVGFDHSTSSNIRRVQFGGSFIEYPVTKLPPSKDLATPSSLAAYADMIHSRGLDPRVLDKPHLTPFHPEAKFDYTENEAGYLEEVLGRTLDFGRIELKRMVAEGNVASAVEWVEMLKPLEDKRLAWKD
ncbi:hypothetical protein RQP46_002522 [Phenoliferia psychrophenolica]